MTKTEKTKILEFIGKLTDKKYSEANQTLKDVVAEKLKNSVRESVQNKK